MDETNFKDHTFFCISLGLEGIFLKKVVKNGNNPCGRWIGTLKFKYIDRKCMTIPDTQRSLKADRIIEIANRLVQEKNSFGDFEICTPIQLTLKNRNIYLNDGQHLVHALKNVLTQTPSYGNDFDVPIMIFEVLDSNEETNLFLKTNKKEAEPEVHIAILKIK